MNQDPTDHEIEHAMTLLQSAEHWDGRMTLIPIDPLCLWDDGSGPCGRILEECCVLLEEEDRNYSAHVLVLCAYHAKCVEAGLLKWRSLS